MKKLLTVLACGASLSIIEYVLLFIFDQFEKMITYSDPITAIGDAFRDTNDISGVRFIFYFVFWVLAIYGLYGMSKIKQPALKLAIWNCALYVLISVVMAMFFPFAVEYFRESFFYYLVISTFLSPFILSIIPGGNKLIKNIE